MDMATIINDLKRDHPYLNPDQVQLVADMMRIKQQAGQVLLATLAEEAERAQDPWTCNTLPKNRQLILAQQIASETDSSKG